MVSYRELLEYSKSLLFYYFPTIISTHLSLRYTKFTMISKDTTYAAKGKMMVNSFFLIKKKRRFYKKFWSKQWNVIYQDQWSQEIIRI